MKYTTVFSNICTYFLLPSPSFLSTCILLTFLIHTLISLSQQKFPLIIYRFIHAENYVAVIIHTDLCMILY